MANKTYFDRRFTVGNDITGKRQLRLRAHDAADLLKSLETAVEEAESADAAIEAARAARDVELDTDEALEARSRRQDEGWERVRLLAIAAAGLPDDFDMPASIVFGDRVITVWPIDEEWVWPRWEPPRCIEWCGVAVAPLNIVRLD